MAITVKGVTSPTIGVTPSNPYPSVATDFPPLKSEVETARGTFPNLDARLDGHDATLTSLDARLGTAEPKITTLQSEMATEKPKITSLQSDMTAEKAKIVTLQADNTTNKANIAALQSGKADKLMATNLITNGDFSNGTSGWSGVDAVVNGIAEKTPNAQYSFIERPHANPTTLRSSKIYVSASVKSPSNLVKLVIIDGTSVIIKNHSGSNSFERLSSIIAVSPTANYCTIKFQDDRASGWDKFYVDNVVSVNLTATFGAGNEPTLAEMDAMMAQYPNSWFNGTQEILPLTEVWKNFNRKADKLMATNLVTNGDFSNGTTGWSPNAVTLTASANKLVSTVKSTFTGGNPSTAISGGVQATNKYYAYVRMKPTSGTPVYIQARLRANSPVESYIFGLKYNPVVNTTYTLSTVYTMSVTSATADIYLDHFYADASSALGQTCEMQYVQVINLTATFGAGNEPTLQEMDLLMSQFPNSWFNGTQELLSLKGVQKELSSKADKVQEAWITPTLINGATGTVQYRRNSTGRIEFRGTLVMGSANPCFTLATTHRPANNTWFEWFATDATKATARVDAGGNINNYGSSGKTYVLDWLSLA